MATKYVSGRVKELKIGISNYSESKESLSVIGIVSATKYFGDGSTLTGIDVTSPSQLNVAGVSTFNDDVQFKGALYNSLWDRATSKFKLYDLAQIAFGDGNDLQIYSDGTYGIIKGNDKTKITGITELNVSGISTFQGDLDIESSVLITGITTIGGLVDINAGGQANTFKVEDLTDNRVVIAGTGGELEDDANLTFNGTQFNVGSGITMYQATGIVSATKFYGDGSNLTGIDATALKDSSGNVKAQANPNGVVFTGIITGNGSGLTDLEIPGISTSGGSTFTNLNVSGVSTFVGFATFKDGAAFSGSAGEYGVDFYIPAWFNNNTPLYFGGTPENEGGTGGDAKLQINGNADGNSYISAGGNSNPNTAILTIRANNLHVEEQNSFHPRLITVTAGAGVTIGGDVEVTGVVTATTFKGALEGNVTGNINGDLTGTLQTAAQPNVTSLGTITSLIASSAKISDLTNGRVVYAGASGELQDSANLTFNGSTLTATAFAGNGSQLTNLPGIDTGGGSVFTNIFSSGINTFGKGATGKVLMYHADSLKFQTTGIGVSVASGTAKTAYIEGPEEIWIDPHPTGVGTTSGIVRIRGDLYVDGKEVIIDVDKIELGDFQIGIATTAGTNVLLDGAGIGIGAQSIRKTITWNNSTSALMSSENWNLASGKHYEIAGTDVLTATTLGSGVVNSSLTSLGTIASLTASTAKVSDLTNTRVVYAGASGELQDSANLTFNGTTLTGTFAGNGAGLTNVAVTGINTGASSDFTDLVVSGNLKVTGISTFTGIHVQDDSGNNDVIIDNDILTNHVFITLKDNCKAQFGNGTDLQIFHDGSNSYVIDQGVGNLILGANDAVRITNGAGTENKIVATTDGSVDLYYDNVKKFETTTTGVTVTGTCQATDFNSTSDIRLKDNIQVIEDPLAKLVQIEGVSFNWKENNKPALGVIADQVQEILPELVTDGDPKTVNYNGLIGLLIEAVKEQQIQINELKSKLP